MATSNRDLTDRSHDLYNFDGIVPANQSNRLATSFGSRQQLRTSAGNITSYGTSTARPMTSNRAAGFTSRGKTAFGKQRQNPFEAKTPDTTETTPLDQLKHLEKRMLAIAEEVAVLISKNLPVQALDRAKSAFQKEQSAIKIRAHLESISSDPIHPRNIELSFFIAIQLASAYNAGKMYSEAVQTYTAIIKNKQYVNGEKVRVNVANIYMEMGKVSQALKVYRMALDQIPSSQRQLKIKVLVNIGIAHMKLGEYQDAINAFETVSEQSSNQQAIYNLILCYHALGDVERMKQAFAKLVNATTPSAQTTNIIITKTKSSLNQLNGSKTPIMKSKDSVEEIDVHANDALQKYEHEILQMTERYILTAAKLIASHVGMSFDWVIQTIKDSSHSHLASTLELAKSIAFLKMKDTAQAIEALKEFEKRDTMNTSVATNLSFLYYLEQDYTNALTYANIAIEIDCYNARAMVSKGNCLVQTKDLESAKACYLDAVTVESTSPEAQFNLALVYKQMNKYQESLSQFHKLNSTLHDNPEVLFNIASIFAEQKQNAKAIQAYEILLKIIPTSPTALSALASLYVSLGDTGQAFHYYTESHRYYPCNVEVCSWIGAYYVECGVFEQAVVYFVKAAEIDRGDVKWGLAVANCRVKVGASREAYEGLIELHQRFTGNAECLKLIVKIGDDMGIDGVLEYKLKLKRLQDLDKVSTVELKSAIVVEKRAVRATVQKEIDWNAEDVDSLLPE